MTNKKKWFFLITLTLLETVVTRSIFANEYLKKQEEIYEKNIKNLTSELLNYHQKTIETSYFLQQVFMALKEKVWDTKDKWDLEEIEKQGSLDAYKSISQKHGLTLIIESYELHYKKIFKNLKIHPQRTFSNKKNQTEYLLDLSLKIFKDTLKLADSFKFLLLSKKILLTYYQDDEKSLRESYEKSLQNLKFTSTVCPYRSWSFFDFIKNQSCLNFDSATNSSAQIFTKTKLLLESFIKALKEKPEKQYYFSQLNLRYKSKLSKVDQETGCLDTYYKIHQFITKIKVTRIKKFLFDPDFKKRKNYINSRLIYSIFPNNHFSKKKDDDLISYFNLKSIQEKNSTEGPIYKEFAARLKGCQRLQKKPGIRARRRAVL